MSETTNNNESTSTGSTRAPYTTPRLQTFGTVAGLTRSVGMTGLLRDKAGTGNNKTM